jgi:hypothetical protein
MKKTLIVFVGLVSLALPSFAAPHEPVKKWTMLLFLNGNNNLNRFGRDNLMEIEKVGSTEQINVVVQWADMEYKRTQRLYMTKSTDPTRVTSPVLAEMGKVDMGDWRTLVDFIRWGVVAYPAKHYFIVVWDHGTGWHDVKIKDISHDDASGHWITTEQLAQALAEAARVIGHKVDLYGSDACQMAMIEIASEVADSVEIYAGSEADIPVNGWPYIPLLTKWSERPEMGARELALLLTREYLEMYRKMRQPKKSATFSVFELGALPRMLSAIRRFGEEIGRIGGDDWKKAKEAMIQTFAVTVDYGDLLDLAEQLETAKLARFDYGAVAELRTAASEFMPASGAVLRFADKAKGISIWMPGEKRWYQKYLVRYSKLKFSLATRWELGIKNLLSK